MDILTFGSNFFLCLFKSKIEKLKLKIKIKLGSWLRYKKHPWSSTLPKRCEIHLPCNCDLNEHETWESRAIQKIWSSSCMDMPKKNRQNEKLSPFDILWGWGWGRQYFWGLKSLTGREEYASVAKGAGAVHSFSVRRFRSYRHYAKLQLTKGFTILASQWRKEIFHRQNCQVVLFGKLTNTIVRYRTVPVPHREDINKRRGWTVANRQNNVIKYKKYDKEDSYFLERIYFTTFVCTKT